MAVASLGICCLKDCICSPGGGSNGLGGVETDNGVCDIGPLTDIGASPDAIPDDDFIGDGSTGELFDSWKKNKKNNNRNEGHHELLNIYFIN